MKENLELSLLKQRGFRDSSETIWTSGRFKQILIEWIIFMAHPYSVLVGKKHYVYNKLIGNYIYYHVNDYLQLLSLARYVYMVPVVLNMTRWKSSSADRICRMYGCKANSGFTIRCLM